MQQKNPYEMCDFMSVFPARRSACSHGVGGAFILKGHVTSWQQPLFSLAVVSPVRSRLPLAQFSTVLHFLDSDAIVSM